MKLLSVARSLTAEVSCEGFYREGGAKNLLAKMIMHLLADPPLLAVGSIQESMLEKPRFGCVAERQKETTTVRSNLKSPDLHGHDRAIFRLAKDLALRHSVVRDSRKTIFKVLASRKNDDAAPDHFFLLPAKDPFGRGAPATHLAFPIHFHQGDSACIEESAESLTLLQPHLFNGCDGIGRSHLPRIYRACQKSALIG